MIDIMIEEEKMNQLASLKKLAHFVPIHAQTKTFDEVKAYIHENVKETNNIRIKIEEPDPSTLILFLDKVEVMFVVNT